MIKTIVIGGQYEDPTEWNGKNPECKLCDKDIEHMDEYCEDHQRCYYCGDRENDCDCSELSDCCGAKFIPETVRCSDCKENSTNYYKN